MLLRWTLVVCVLAGLLAAQDKAVMPFYGNAKCPVDGKEVNRKLYLEVDGERVHVCSKECRKKADADPAASKKSAYPDDKVVDVKNERCPCMPKAAKAEHSVTWQGHKVGLCCKKCVAKFKQSPARYLTLALNKDLVAVGNKKCPVMPDEDVDAEFFVLYKGKLIDLCCDSCVEDFKPEEHMKKLPEPKREDGGTPPGSTGSGGGR
jgi:YHS domain-containing protein